MIEIFWYLAHILLLHITTSFQAITNLGGRMLGNFDCYFDIPILIVDADDEKTVCHKFIWAQGNDAPIVTLDYITASEAHGSFLETGLSEVVNIRGLDDHTKKFIKNGLVERKTGGIYRDKIIFISREASTSKIMPAKTETEKLIKAVDGQLVTPRKLKALVNKNEPILDLIVLVNENADPKKNEVIDAIDLGGQRLTDREFLDSLLLGSFPKRLWKPTGSTKKPETCATQLKPAGPVRKPDNHMPRRIPMSRTTQSQFAASNDTAIDKKANKAKTTSKSPLKDSSTSNISTQVHSTPDNCKITRSQKNPRRLARPRPLPKHPQRILSLQPRRLIQLMLRRSQRNQPKVQ